MNNFLLRTFFKEHAFSVRIRALILKEKKSGINLTFLSLKGPTGQTGSAREGYQWIGRSKDLSRYRFRFFNFDL